MGMEMTHVTPDSRGQTGLLITTSSDYQRMKSGYLSQLRKCSRYKAAGQVKMSQCVETDAAGLGPHALELTCGNTVQAFSVNDPLIFAEGFYITSEGTSAGEQLAVIREEFSLKIKSLKLASSH